VVPFRPQVFGLTSLAIVTAAPIIRSPDVSPLIPFALFGPRCDVEIPYARSDQKCQQRVDKGRFPRSILANQQRLLAFRPD